MSILPEIRVSIDDFEKLRSVICKNRNQSRNINKTMKKLFDQEKNTVPTMYQGNRYRGEEQI